ncbi:MAG TPA: BrxA/BrxB family bacilliredoxin, partial [Pyrinomonadaceae bacterium]
DATAKAREHFAPYPPSSPQVALFKDGRLVYMLERHQIETRHAEEIAHELTQAFRRYCAPADAATA